MDENLLKIINHYGVMPQLKYLQSEVFELNQAVIECNTYDEFAQADMNVFHKNREYFIKHIAEEIADCTIFLKQFQYYYGISDENIEKIMKEKIERTIKRTEEGYYDK